jgi:hypothetical protein
MGRASPAQLTASSCVRKGADRARLITQADNHNHGGSQMESSGARSAACLLGRLQPIQFIGEGSSTGNDSAYMLRIVVRSPQN